jgi:hypothetical protein
MKLTQILGMDANDNRAILVGTPVITNFEDSEGKPYYEATLLKPIKVTCSTEPSLGSFETEVVYIREAALNEEGWKLVEEGKPEAGFYREGWVVDFSTGQELPLYQERTIKKWFREKSKGDRADRNSKLTAKIKAGQIGKKTA